MNARILEGYRILVVDDNEPSRQLLQTLLKAVGADVTEAGNGQTALEMSTSEHFDAVLMDIQMPVLDGLEATKRIRDIEARSDDEHRLIVGVTAHAMQEHKEMCLAAGMDAVITKPIDPESVARTVKGLIDSPPGRAS